MSASRKTCVFCQKTGVAMSHEHVFPRWLAGLFPGGTTAWSYRKFQIPNDGHTTVPKSSTWQSAPDDTGIKFGRVCVVCNTGWMARLERDAAPILKPLIAGNVPVTVTVAEQLVILRWTMEMAFLFDVLRPIEYPPFFRPDDRSTMARAADFPFHPLVTLANYQGQTNGLGAFFAQMIYGAHGTDQGGLSADQVEFHITLNLGRLAIQLVCLAPNPRGSKVRMKPLSHLWRGFTADITCSTELLPRRTGEVAWPTPRSLDDALFAAFRDRWMVQYLAEGHLSQLEQALRASSG